MQKIHLTILYTALFILGILTYIYGLFLYVSISVILLLIFLFLKYKIKARYAIIGFLFFIFAFINSSIQIKEEDNLSLLVPKNAILSGVVSSIPSNNIYNKTSFFVDVEEVKTDKKHFSDINSKIFLSIMSDSDEIGRYEIGDRIEFQGKIQKPYKVGNPNQFNYAKFLKYKDTFTVMYIKDEDCKVVGEPNSVKWKFLQKLNRLRHEIILKQSKYIKSPNIEILGGVVFGDEAVNPPEDIKESFITTGILHILAASGMNIAFIFSIMYCLLGLLKIPYKTKTIISAGTVLVYACMTGFPPSIIRAIIMMEFVVLGKLINKNANSLSLLAFSALIMLSFNPSMLFNISFQLSFIVTFGIILFAPIIYEYLSQFGGYYNKLSFLFIPIIAQIFVIPLQMFYFQTFSTYSFLANILIIPFLSVISFGGFINSILNLIPYVSDFSNHIFSYILNPCLSVLIGISDFFANLEHALVSTYKMNFYQIIFYYFIVIFLYLTLKNNAEKIRNYVVCVFCLLLLLLSFVKIPNKNLEIIFFDVQNADCILIKSPENKYFLIDSGKLGYKTNYSQIRSIVIPYLKEQRVREIEAFIITHFDSDHCGGALELFKNFKVKHVVMTPNEGNSFLSKEIRKYILDNKISYSLAENNNVFYEEDNFKLTNFYMENKKNKNESSIVSVVENNGEKFLFCADATINILEKFDLPNGIKTIKVAHHGAKNTLSREFLEKYNVENAIISTGRNQYNHPNQETLEILQAQNINIFRTDLDNALRISNSDKKFKIFLYNSEKDNWQKVHI